MILILVVNTEIKPKSGTSTANWFELLLWLLDAYLESLTPLSPRPWNRIGKNAHENMLTVWVKLQPDHVLTHICTLSCSFLGNWMWCIAWTVKWYACSILKSGLYFLLCWYNMFYFAQPVALMPCLFHLISFQVSAVIIKQISFFLHFLHFLLLHVIRQTVQPNFLSCHPAVISNMRGKKITSPSTETIIQTSNLGHIICSRTFSATFMGDEGAKSIQGCIVTCRRNPN